MAEPAGRAMSDEHKAALVEGRAESRAVRTYLEALAQSRPRRGRRRTTDSITKRLAVVDHELETASALTRLQLVQERMDLTRELETMGTTVDISAAEADFVRSAAGYAKRKGISYAAWREAGVPADVLKKAGITRGTN